MTFRRWSIGDWTRRAGRMRIPATTVSRAAGYEVACGYIDSADNLSKRDTIAERCEFVGGLVLAAEVLGDISPERALVVFGDGPTALIAIHVALARGLPVVGVTTEGVEAMTPLAGCYTRWVAPYFYDTLAGGELADYWRWTPPPAFAELEDEDLRWVRGFHYGHQDAGFIAESWLRHSHSLPAQLAAHFSSAQVTPEAVTTRGLAAVLDVARAALVATAELGLVLECRLFEKENLTLTSAEGHPLFTSVPYFEKGRTTTWPGRDGPVAISGSGNGALQDFLRATWRWHSLEAAAQTHARLFQAGQWTVALRAQIAELDAHWAGLRSKWDALEDERVTARAEGRDLDDRMKQAQRHDQNDFHRRVAVKVEEILPVCHPWAALAHLKPREVRLYTRNSTFGFCFPHNLFFALLTIRLQEEAGRDVHLSGLPHLPVSYQAEPPLDASDEALCTQAALQGLFKIEGFPAAECILVRHSPSHTSLMEW